MEKDIAVIGNSLFQAKSPSLYVNEPIQKYKHERLLKRLRRFIPNQSAQLL